MKARIIIGANYGDEGKGTVTATYTKNSKNVLNVLTNGGAQRGHSILTKDGNITFQHFGAGTYHGADNYYSRFFILNPMQFVKEYETLIVKPKHIYRDPLCRWSTPYDSMANIIEEQARHRKASCCMGIWNTIRRFKESYYYIVFDEFMSLVDVGQLTYLNMVKEYYEKRITIPSEWQEIWNSKFLQTHFIEDCKFMHEHTTVCGLSELDYENMIFENGQGLLLSDTGKDTFDTTPSNTGITYALELLKELHPAKVTAHYVTRPYMTRHGDGNLMGETDKRMISSGVTYDRTNFFNEFQGEFRYGSLDFEALKNRIQNDARGVDFELEITHCDEMDKVKEAKMFFDKVNCYDTPLIK